MGTRSTNDVPDSLASQTTVRGAAPDEGGEGAAAASRSDLYGKPVPFQGRSLEGVSSGDRSMELARSLDVEMPVEELLPVAPCPVGPDRVSIVMSHPVVDADEDARTLMERRAAFAKSAGRGSPGRRDPMRDEAGGRSEARVRKAADARWAVFSPARLAAPVSFGDEPRRLLNVVEHEIGSSLGWGGKSASSYGGAELPYTLDCVHAPHHTLDPGSRIPKYGTGFGQGSRGWNACPFSSRERILNALSTAEALDSGWTGVSEAGDEGGRAACGSLASSQYRAMASMDPQPGGDRRHAPWRMHGARGTRLHQLIEMLDQAAAVV